MKHSHQQPSAEKINKQTGGEAKAAADTRLSVLLDTRVVCTPEQRSNLDY